MSARTKTLESPPASAQSRAAPQLVFLWQCDQPRESSLVIPLAGWREVRVGRGESRAVRPGADGSLSIELPDGRASSRHFNLLALAGGWAIEDSGSKNGTLVNGIRVTSKELRDGDLIECGHSFFRFRAQVADGGGEPREAVALPSGLGTTLPSLQRMAEALPAVSRSSAPVIINGESGTGKELLAREVHRLSGRGGPFLAINCAALPRSLLESELFGFRKGAFSGALENRPGLFRSAEKGTLFLDEIGDMPIEAQAAILRVIQEGEVLPIGETAPVPIDCRIVSATHRDLSALTDSLQFRADLLARLSGSVFALPPLRARKDDLPLLIAALLEKLAPSPAAITFTPAAARALFKARWQFNIRQLEQVLRIALALSGGAVDEKHLALDAAPLPTKPAKRRPQLSPADEARVKQLEKLLREHSGNISAVARAMGKARMQIHRWLSRFELDPEDYRLPEEKS